MTRPLFISCTDIHFTTKVPPCRLPSFINEELKKFKFLMEEAEKTEFKTILCAGDVFDSATKNMNYEFLSSLLAIFREHYDVKFMTVVGNHDMRYRDSSLMNTPLQFMSEILPYQFRILNTGTQHWYSDDNDGAVFVHPVNWGESISESISAFLDSQCNKWLAESKIKKQFHIVLGHITTFESQLPHWADPNTCYVASDLIDRVSGYLSPSECNLIITGDNHEQFFVLGHGISLINTGPIFRSTISTKDMKPQYAEIWFDRAKICDIPCEDNPFNQEYIGKQRELKEATSINFDELISEIDANYSMTNDFTKAIQAVVKSKHPELLSKLEKIINNDE